MNTITELAEALRAAKAAEHEAREQRLAVEAAILEHPAVAAQIKDEGTATIDKMIKVTTGYTRAWDPAVLHTMSAEVDPAFWPFRPEWKEDRKLARRIEEHHPDLWERLREALTIKPRKPTVSLTD